MSRHLKNYVATRAATRLVMDAAKSEKAKAGRVTMPKVFFVIGIIGFVLLATATFLCGRIPHAYMIKVSRWCREKRTIYSTAT